MNIICLCFFCIDRIELHRIYHEVIFPSQHASLYQYVHFLILLRQWRKMKCSSTFPTMILLFGAIILFSAFLRAIESGTLFTISDSGMKRALNKVLEQYFRIFARHKELEKYFRDLLHLRLWWVVCPPFPISN